MYRFAFIVCCIACVAIGCSVQKGLEAQFDYFSYDDWGNPHKNEGAERQFWTYKMPQSSVTASFCQNISGRGKAPTGWQRVYANEPTKANPFAYMRISCFNTGGGCLPYPKIRLDISKKYDKIVRLQSYVQVTVPHTGNCVYNTSFDIYFQKTGQQLANYCAFMVWLNKRGGMGPAGNKLSWKDSLGNLQSEIVIDSVAYNIIGRTNFTNNDYIINFIRVKYETHIPNIDVLKLMQFVSNRKLFSTKIIQGVVFTDSLSVDFSGATLTNYNLGFEIFKANNLSDTTSNKSFDFIINRFATDFRYK